MKTRLKLFDGRKVTVEQTMTGILRNICRLSWHQRRAASSNNQKFKIMAKKISINKVARQIKVAYRVNDNEALELVPMFVRKAA